MGLGTALGTAVGGTLLSGSSASTEHSPKSNPSESATNEALFEVATANYQTGALTSAPSFIQQMAEKGLEMRLDNTSVGMNQRATSTYPIAGRPGLAPNKDISDILNTQVSQQNGSFSPAPTFAAQLGLEGLATKNNGGVSADGTGKSLTVGIVNNKDGRSR